MVSDVNRGMARCKTHAAKGYSLAFNPRAGGEFHIARPQPGPHSGPTTPMKALFLAALLSITSAALLCGAEPTKLSAVDQAALMKTAQSVQRAFDAGDADA